MARVNSSTIYALNKDMNPCKLSSFEFAFDLVMALVKPQIELRKKNNLHVMTQNKIQMIIGKAAAQPPDNDLGPPISEKRMRCHACMLEIAGEGKRANKDHVNSIKFSMSTVRQTYMSKPSGSEMRQMSVIVPTLS